LGEHRRLEHSLVGTVTGERIVAPTEDAIVKLLLAN
jgi:hypothetical protein